MQALNHKQIVSLIKSVGPSRTVLVEGEAGVGKTSILYELAKDPDYAQHHVIKPIDCTQLADGSVWMPDIDRVNGVSRELPNERFGVSKSNRRGIDGSTPVVICLDEIAKARQSIKDIIAPIVYERRIGEYYLPERSVVFACTNLSVEGLGDSMQAHLRNRLVRVQMRKPTKDEWLNDFAITNGLHEAVLATVEEFPQVFESFMDYQPGGSNASKKLAQENPYIFNPSAQQDAWVTPRSLHAASDVLQVQDAMDDTTLEAALSGTVGRAFAAQMASYIRFGKQLPSFARIVADPEGTPLPNNAAAQIVLAFKLLTQTNTRDEAAAVTTFISRANAEMRTLFATNVSRSTSKMAHFVTVAPFTKLLADTRKFFNA
jgi:hypothetical protein